jgi:DNA-binding transcriptional ArsR family regulator
MNNPLRQKMLALIHKDGQMMVTDLYQALHIKQAIASHHLGILRRAKIVNTESSGNKVFYSLNYEKIKEVYVFAERLSN